MQTETQFLSKDGNHKIHAVIWKPENVQIRAVLQISHGMMEYIERYHDFATYMNANGFLVVGNDMLGHGHSVNQKSELGHIPEKNGADIIVEDMHQLRKITQQQYGDLPYFMLGHSMGSYMLRRYLTVHGKGLAGAIIMGTGTVENAAAKMAMVVCRLTAGIHGWKYCSPMVEKMTRGGSFKAFCSDDSQPQNSWLTKDINIVKKYYSDPLCTFPFTLGAYACLFDTVYYDNQLEHVQKIPENLPVVFLSGASDPVGDMGQGVEKAYHLFQKAGIKNVTCHLYQADRHEILNETDRRKIYKDISAWCNTLIIE